MATCFKCGCSSTPKNGVIAQKNTALNVFYGLAYKTRPLFSHLSRIFKKRGFSPSGATFLQMRPQTLEFCSVMWILLHDYS